MATNMVTCRKKSNMIDMAAYTQKVRRAGSREAVPRAKAKKSVSDVMVMERRQLIGQNWIRTATENSLDKSTEMGLQ